ncbi:MAG: peptidoglycan editing factor PgeF, partial [Cyanobacteria bacterium J06642_3]
MAGQLIRTTIVDESFMNQQWNWHGQDYPYLTCKLLSSWRHGFFTAQFYPQTPSELTHILQPQTEAYRVKQIHGNLVLTPQEINQIVNQDNYPNSLAQADAVISDRSKQSVWVASADCTPVLIGDLATGQVAAIHAGWRGTALKIVPQAIARFLKFGSKLQNLRIALGPAISGQMYQVDQSVALKVGQSVIEHANNPSEAAILAQLKQLSPKPILDDELPAKIRLDVAAINQIQLEQLGINSEQIAIAPYCTYQHKNLDTIELFWLLCGDKRKNNVVQW